MIQSISAFIYDGLDSVWDWATQIYDAFGISLVALVIAVVMVYAIGKYILAPFVGFRVGGASDRAGSGRSFKGFKKRSNTSSKSQG